MEEYGNDWCFGGKVIYAKAMTGEGSLGGSIRILGQSKRKNQQPHPVEFGCLVMKEDWDYLIRSGLNPDMFKPGNNSAFLDQPFIEVCGHFEYWSSMTEGGNFKHKEPKVVDSIVKFIK